MYQNKQYQYGKQFWVVAGFCISVVFWARCASTWKGTASDRGVLPIYYFLSHGADCVLSLCSRSYEFRTQAKVWEGGYITVTSECTPRLWCNLSRRVAVQCKSVSKSVMSARECCVQGRCMQSHQLPFVDVNTDCIAVKTVCFCLPVCLSLVLKLFCSCEVSR